jgi:hypothetical protein
MEPERVTVVTPFSVGDRITLKKNHPCGGAEWEIVRIGADLGFVCLKCQRRITLSRREAVRRIKTRTPRPDQVDSAER